MCFPELCEPLLQITNPEEMIRDVGDNVGYAIGIWMEWESCGLGPLWELNANSRWIVSEAGWTDCPAGFGELVGMGNLVTELSTTVVENFTKKRKGLFLSQVLIPSWIIINCVPLGTSVSIRLSFFICTVGTMVSLLTGVRKIWENMYKILRAANGSSSDQRTLFMVNKEIVLESFSNLLKIREGSIRNWSRTSH